MDTGETAQPATCYYHTGGSFTTVPVGRYLHITHITFTAFTGAATGDMYAFVYNSGNSSILHKVITPAPDTVAMNFNTPALIIEAGDQLVVDNSGDHAIVLTATGFTSDQIEDPTALTAVRAGVVEPNTLLPAGLLLVLGGLSLFIFWQVRREQA